MNTDFHPAAGSPGGSTRLRIATEDPIEHLRLHQPDKRDALSDALVREPHTAFVHRPQAARVAVFSGEGAHFGAGRDLSEVTEQGVGNAPLAHDASTRARARSAERAPAEGLLAESLVSPIARDDEATTQRVRGFQNERAGEGGIRP